MAERLLGGGASSTGCAICRVDSSVGERSVCASYAVSRAIEMQRVMVGVDCDGLQWCTAAMAWKRHGLGMRFALAAPLELQTSIYTDTMNMYDHTVLQSGPFEADSKSPMTTTRACKASSHL